MEIIVGSIIVKDNKILMVKEAKKQCYSKWSFPAGHLEKNETIFEGAKRETLEETGCKVELKKVLPILMKNDENKNVMIFNFLSDILEENDEYHTSEILETKWLDIEEIKRMKEDEFRSYSVVKNVLKSIEDNNFNELSIIENLYDI